MSNNGNIKLYSWVDVKDRLLDSYNSSNWKKGVKIETRGSGSYISYLKDKISKTEVLEWLNTLFPNSIEGDKLELESLGATKRYLDLYFEEEDTFSDSRYIPDFSRPRSIGANILSEISRPDNTSPVMIATHSFKGGVGRTLHALALASFFENAKPENKVLFIDADFEAPGTTWLTPYPEIAFVDVLNLIHSTEDPLMIVDSVAESVRNQAQGNIFFLPAYRVENQLRPLEIAPEHIYKYSENPFIITDIVSKIAQSIGANHVIVDLRAGISELSSSWLIDSRISNVLVTTLNSQSIEGTLITLDLLQERILSQGGIQLETPSIIVSQVNSEQLDYLKKVWGKDEEPNKTTAAHNILRLRNKIDTLNNLFEGNEMDFEFVITPHISSLLVLPNNWPLLKDMITRSGLVENVKNLADFYSTETSVNNDTEESEVIDARSKMAEVMPDLIYAEKSIPTGFYKSNSIRNLANRNKTRLPNTVIVGSKGAGKTFLYRQLYRSNNWSSFLKSVTGDNETKTFIDAKIYRVTFPDAIDEHSEVWIKIIKPYLIEELDKDNNVIDWRNIWLDVMAWSYGFEVGNRKIADSFIKHLEENTKKAIFIFDGLEDLFQSYYKDEKQKTAMRSLIQDVHSWISVTPNSPIGQIIFIRQDMVEHVISQNEGQFLDKHKEFFLTWDRTEALRLVAWVLSFYEIIELKNIKLEDIPNASEAILNDALYVLWGRKLGGDSSREARSANKILNILSNFNGEIQSRDLMRFLDEAIKQEQSTEQSYKDRILSPPSVKEAFPNVGKSKLKEVKEENKNNKFAAILITLEGLSSSLKVPFSAESGLSSEDISILIEQGVLRRYNERYHMAELYRLGLDISKSKGRIKTEFYD